MNLQDQVIYRCIHAACARPLPRRVNFCPYCGTGQHDGVVNPAHAARPVQAQAPVQVDSQYRAAPAEPPPAAVPAAVTPVIAPVASAPVGAPPAASPAVASVAAAAAPAPAASPVPPAQQAPEPAARVAQPEPVPAAPRPVPAAPPRREPVRMRYWLIALAALWAIWLYARPSANRIESRVVQAIADAGECRLNVAQSALIELRLTKATPEQLTRLQSAMNSAAPGCEKKKQRGKAWEDTITAVESALAAGDFARAQSRLAQFTRRFNEDEATRKMKEKIAEQRAAAPPAPAPFERVEPVEPVGRAAPSSSQTQQSVRNLINEAERALLMGNYKGASDKLETCITMVDAGNRECAAFKVHADRMQNEQERCLSAGREWSADRCR